MVDNRYRHLPVTDQNGAVVGMLDIGKCLNDAITKLEKQQDKNGNSANEAIRQVVDMQGANSAQVAALQMLLGPLLGQSSTDQLPTLRSLLKQKPKTIVRPGTSVRDAAVLMAENLKASLIVDNGKLVGIVTFKDIMTRAIAKELPFDETSIDDIMTSNPECADPGMTVLEALQVMHDNKFLTLPVCEKDGSVVGIVDVIDLIYGCGGVEGWKSIFGATLDIAGVDNESVISATKSVKSNRNFGTGPSTTKIEPKADRAVSKLRPNKPIITNTSDTILQVCQAIANKRGFASLIAADSGELTGIITDKDIVRRVVARDIDANREKVSSVMTKNPTFVYSSDMAMDALGIMIDNRYRHLPVIDNDGHIVGLLNISKCLNDAISKLERHQKKTENNSLEDIKKLTIGGSNEGQTAVINMLLGQLLNQSGDKSIPTLRSLIREKPTTIVQPGTNIQDAATVMADHLKAALVVDDGDLLGIVSFKDVMTRAVAKQLPPQLTDVATIMTPNPEVISPEATALEAIQVMNDHKILTLPVCENDGTVVGIVDVMDVIYGCGGADGWRSIFGSSLDIDDVSDTASVRSNGSRKSAGSRATSVKSARNVDKPLTSKSNMETVEETKDERPVSKLRPSKPLVSNSSHNVLQVAKMLAGKRGTAAIIINDSGSLEGIITDKDFTRRVVARHLDPTSTEITSVMTKKPTCVSMSDSAMEALNLMIENRYRHLPVLDDFDNVVGLLDISKCLNDTISKLERQQKRSNASVEDAVKQVSGLQGASQAQVMALQALLGPLLNQSNSNSSVPTLRGLLTGRPTTIVRPGMLFITMILFIQINLLLK